ncbi:MAG: thioredoxin-dependent thiol peroxidase [Acidimicrobiia bacterium]|nr:thioredoxin-dependent thiol peroxidase [Acidimicrobiia bacterium]
MADAMLAIGTRAPAFTLLDQRGEKVRLSSFKGRRVLIFFYPKALTGGCTTQACGLRDVADRIGDTVILGISPDEPPAQARFDDKYSLGFPLLSDPDHAVADKYGTWGPKKLYGREYEGIIRSSFLVGATGRLEHVWYKISPKATPENLLGALQGGVGR